MSADNSGDRRSDSTDTPFLTTKQEPPNKQTNKQAKTMNRRVNSILPVALATIALGGSPAFATLLFYEGFAAGDYTEGDLNGQPTVGAGYAAGGTWNTASQFISGGLTAPGLATTDGFRLSRSDGEVIGNFDTSAGGTFGTAGLIGSNGLIGGTGVTASIYFSILGNRTDTQAASFAGFNIYNGGDEGVGVGEVAGSDYSWLQGGGNGAIGSPGTPLAPGETHLFVIRLDYDAANPLSATVWLDPDTSLAEGAQAAGISTDIAAAKPVDGFDSFRLRGSRVWEFDEIRIGTTWADVTPVPEPSGPLLALVGVAGLLLHRRRRC